MIKQGNGALSGTRTHATGFGDLYSIQLSYERASTSYQKKPEGKATIYKSFILVPTLCTKFYICNPEFHPFYLVYLYRSLTIALLFTK